MVRHIANGFSLFEVLISLMLLSIASLAIANIQFFTLKNDQHAYYRAVAATQVISLANVLYLDPKHFQTFMREWNQRNQQFLPQGIGYVRDKKIIISWLERDTKTVLQFKI